MQRPRLWLLPLLLAVLVGGGWYFGVRSKAADRELPVYVRGAERLVAGEELYRRGTDDKPFTYPPFAAVPFVPFTWLPQPWQAPVWFAVNFIVLLAVLRWMVRWHRRTRDGPAVAWPRAVWPWVLIAAIAARHVFSVFENQSHDLLVLGVATAIAAAWCRNGTAGWLAAGAAAGVGGAFKATPLLFLEVFAVRRAVVAVIAATATFAVLCLVPDLLFPRQDGASGIVRWYEVNLRGLEVGGTAAAAGAWNAHSFLNQSLSGTLTRLLSSPAQPGAFVREDVVLAQAPAAVLRGAILLGQLVVVGAVAWGALRARRAVRAAVDPAAAQYRVGLGECGLVVCGMVLLSPQSSKAHFCVLLLPALFCVGRLLRDRRDLLLWLLVLGAAALGAFTAKDLLGREAGNVALALGAVTWSTMLLLFATLRALRPDRS